METKQEKIFRLLGGRRCFVKDGKFFFISMIDQHCSAGESLLGRIQDFVKQFGRLYDVLIKIFGPIYYSQKFKKCLRNVIAEQDERSIILNVGAGLNTISSDVDVINIDIYDFSPIDVVCDVNNIPFDDSSVDVVINLAMLEHVNQPEKIIHEFKRVLKPGGQVVCYIPFIAPFHAAPNDFMRWTSSGAHLLFSDFSSLQVEVGAGPTSGLLWVLQEWISLILSFGNSKLKDILFIFVMVLTCPFKYLDILFEWYPQAEKIASGFYIHATK